MYKKANKTKALRIIALLLVILQAITAVPMVVQAVDSRSSITGTDLSSLAGELPETVAAETESSDEEGNEEVTVDLSTIMRSQEAAWTEEAAGEVTVSGLTTPVINAEITTASMAAETDAEQSRGLVAGTSRFGMGGSGVGTNTISQVIGFDSHVWLSMLEAQEGTSYYLGTPSRPYDWRSPNGDTYYNNGTAGLNCTGFIWYTIAITGADQNRIPHLVGFPNCSGGWGAFINNNDILTYDFPDKDSLLSSGVLEKGDILWIWDEVSGGANALSDNHHIGIYWGDGSNDLMWHTDGPGNRISEIVGYADIVSYTVVKMGFPAKEEEVKPTVVVPQQPMFPYVDLSAHMHLLRSR